MKLMTGLGMSYLQTDDSFAKWEYGPVNDINRAFGFSVRCVRNKE